MPLEDGGPHPSDDGFDSDLHRLRPNQRWQSYYHEEQHRRGDHTVDAEVYDDSGDLSPCASDGDHAP
ncbi:hypothetical protein BRADI_1g45987v3 [Brachypodium distachyon]|uniref:Uncharacterized protein n=1 Tax=Brachypodium distachyon TaxID=15368 RepID=A0A2K2DPL9_BRADI|nr:hypothetical protein BRADI_1g45987v3 [Brachypodium distachyon]